MLMKVEVYFPPDYPGGRDFHYTHEATSPSVPEALRETYEALSDIRSHPIDGRYVMIGDVFRVSTQSFIMQPSGFRPVSPQYVAEWIKKPLIDRITGSGAHAKVISYSQIPLP